MVPVSYGERWNPMLGRPVDEIFPDEARRRYVDGPWFTAVIGNRARPESYIEIDPEKGFFGVHFLDTRGSVWLKYSFRRVDGRRLFLERVTRWLYPEDGQRHVNMDAVLVEKVHLRPDGTVERTTVDNRTGEGRKERLADVPMDASWEAVPEFGDFDSIARLDRDHSAVTDDRTVFN
jgi:hypothetical protein